MSSSGVQTCADRKSTRLNSSHTIISYAVFCLKKKSSDRKSTRLNSSHTIISYAVFCLKKADFFVVNTTTQTANTTLQATIAVPLENTETENNQTEELEFFFNEEVPKTFDPISPHAPPDN